MPVSPLLIEVLNSYGHEGVHAFHIGLDSASDDELIELARTENRIIVTADLDFPRILALGSYKNPGVILFRGGNYSNLEMQQLMETVLNEISPDDLVSSICVVDKKRIRITRLPLRIKF